MQVTATEAKNRFGSMCAHAKRAPVTVLKDGLPDTVILSFSDFEDLNKNLVKKTMTQRQREFNETYKDWIAEQNTHFETQGHWSQGLVSWRDGV